MPQKEDKNVYENTKKGVLFLLKGISTAFAYGLGVEQRHRFQ